jgi:asparagine synthase (glutamine-hydrolysing)
MFAMAIWDSRKKSLYLVRDRFGIKPLFYTITGDALWFASEIKALLKVPGFEKEISTEALHHYFSFDYIPGDITAFKGIKEVRPGFVLEVQSAKSIEPVERQYWQPVYGDSIPPDMEDALSDIRGLLKNAVRYHLISDVPVGVMLSGGMDSSVLALFMSQIRGSADFNTFSVGFNERSFDESNYARLVSDRLGTLHHSVLITPRSIKDNLERCLSYIDEPYADGSAIPTYLLSQEAKKYVTVLLSGEGGDEVFAGYETHLAYYYREAYRKLPIFMRRMCRDFSSLMPVSHKKLSLGFKIKKFVAGAEYNVAVSHYKWREVFSEDEKRELFRLKDLERQYGPSSGLFQERFAQLASADELNKLLGVDCSYHLPDDLMIKNDRMTMAHSLEARVPFTDLDLFNYLANLSGSVKIRGFQLKYLLRKAMEPFLPGEIIAKPKVGLEIPYSQWLCGELKELLLGELSESSLKNTPFINPVYVQRLIREHLTRRADRGRELWGLLNFAVWYRLYFIDKIY